jgi:inner membrane protein
MSSQSPGPAGWIANPPRLRLGLKAAMVAAMVLLLMIPLAMIRGTIAERQAYRQEAVASVAESHAGAQVLAGPVLVIPYVETLQVASTDAFGKPVLKTERREGRWMRFPVRSHLDGKLVPAVRQRGLYEVRVYELQSRIDSDFDLVLPADPGGVRRIGAPWLSIAIADVRGLVGTPALRLDDRVLVLQQGPGAQRGGGGLHADTGLGLVAGTRLRFQTHLQLALGGTETLALAPVADSNAVDLRSSWPHPQFAGRFLPRARRISGAGFQAHWDVSALASSTQAQWLQGAATRDLEALSVGLVEPVNVYSQADRASKYGLLFVCLTFAGFFLFEVLKRLRIHPIQYVLVGLALAIFFLLLLSLSEHMAFWIAYLASSVACIGLLGAYLSSVLRSRSRGLGFAAILTALYAALYGLLVSEDNALVLGSLLLFAILAAAMLATRRIDWYAASAGTATADAVGTGVRGA